MKRTFGPSWPRRGCGLTLVEAVAGIAVLGSLLAAVLVATGRLRAQDARAARRIEACAVAEELLAGWWKKPEQLPRTGEGTVRGRKGWHWRTRTVQREQARALRAEVVVVEVFSSGPAPTGLDAPEAAPAARVEIVLPALRRDPNAPQERTDAD